jgi:hypothetical protein
MQSNVSDRVHSDCGLFGQGRSAFSAMTAATAGKKKKTASISNL